MGVCERELWEWRHDESDWNWRERGPVWPAEGKCILLEMLPPCSSSSSSSTLLTDMHGLPPISPIALQAKRNTNSCCHSALSDYSYCSCSLCACIPIVVVVAVPSWSAVDCLAFEQFAVNLSAKLQWAITTSTRTSTRTRRRRRTTTIIIMDWDIFARKYRLITFFHCSRSFPSFLLSFVHFALQFSLLLFIRRTAEQSFIKRLFPVILQFLRSIDLPLDFYSLLSSAKGFHPHSSLCLLCFGKPPHSNFFLSLIRRSAFFIASSDSSALALIRKQHFSLPLFATSSQSIRTQLAFLLHRFITFPFNYSLKSSDEIVLSCARRSKFAIKRTHVGETGKDRRREEAQGRRRRGRIPFFHCGNVQKFATASLIMILFGLLSVEVIYNLS